MSFTQIYKTPAEFSDLVLCSDGEFLTGLCFAGSRDAAKLRGSCTDAALPVFEETAAWLDVYFRGAMPDFVPKYALPDCTPFRREVTEILCTIPYGETVTYGEIARQLAGRRGVERMSAQAVGGAVGFNPLYLLVPCHRVMGANGALTGYGGGLSNKIALLKLEGHDVSRFTLPSAIRR